MNKEELRIRAGGPLQGRVVLPGDKSISHRSLLLNGFSEGLARVTGLLGAEDVRSTEACLRQLGVRVEAGVVEGSAGELTAPDGVLDCGNSGTTMRLLLGLLAGQGFPATLTGDASLQRRPMERVAGPLALLGGKLDTTGGRPPVRVLPARLHGARVSSPVASAQVKSAVLLAGLQAEGEVVFSEPRVSRDHTERMLGAMGVELQQDVGPKGEHTITMQGGQAPQAVDVVIPGDISSAAFLLVAASIVPRSRLEIHGVGLNPTRTGVLDVLERMGASVEVSNQRQEGGEPVGDLLVCAAELQGTEVGGAEIPRLIDELPVIAVAASFAQGVTRIRDAEELRVKESDRIARTVAFLRDMGVSADETPDGMVIEGAGAGAQMEPAYVEAGRDHRIAMSAAVAGLVGRGETVVGGAGAIRTSFPEFPTLLESLRA